MIDIIGAIALTALFALCCVTVTSAAPIDAGARWKLSLAALTWFIGVGICGAAGVFAEASLGTAAIGAAILTPIVLSLSAAARSLVVRQVALATPLPVLVGIHAGRLLGVFFVLLFEAGRLPPTFALTAGWGDIVVASAALPLAWAIHRQVSGWRIATLTWNTVGLVDLVAAVTLGVGSAQDSPIRFIFESPNSGAVATLPWVLIPAVLVPMYLLSHLAIFARMTGTRGRTPRTREHQGALARA